MKHSTYCASDCVKRRVTLCRQPDHQNRICKLLPRQKWTEHGACSQMLSRGGMCNNVRQPLHSGVAHSQCHVQEQALQACCGGLPSSIRCAVIACRIISMLKSYSPSDGNPTCNTAGCNHQVAWHCTSDCDNAVRQHNEGSFACRSKPCKSSSRLERTSNDQPPFVQS